MFRKEVLDNGVRVVTERIPSVRSVSIGIWVDVGSRDEQPGEEGFSHFIEHMVFKGTRRRSAEAISGEVATIEALRRAPLLSFRARHYRPSQVVVAVAGNFAFGPVLKQLASAFGGPWDSETGSAHRVPPTVTKGVHVRSKPLEQAHICVGAKGIAPSDKDRYAVYALNAVLGGGVSSRLFQEVREKRGLAYSIYSFVTCFTDSGLVTVYAGVRPDAAPRAIRLILKELQIGRAHV